MRVFTTDDIRKLTEFGASRIDEREAAFAALKRAAALVEREPLDVDELARVLREALAQEG